MAAAVNALLADGVVAFPTETFYGLAVNPRSSSAVRKVFALKQRPPDQPLPLIAADVAQVRQQVGTMSALAERLAAFAGYTVTTELMSLAASDAIVMHCLPAYRGKEIDAEVLDGPQSVVWDEAENRRHAQKAIITWLMRESADLEEVPQ